MKNFDRKKESERQTQRERIKNTKRKRDNGKLE